MRHFLGLMGKTLFIALVLAFFVIPVLWLVFAPFDAHPSLTIKAPQFTFHNFEVLFQTPGAIASLGNSIILALGTMILVLVLGALASYALSRVKIPGRDILLYTLLLLSSIITGTAAMVPTFLLMVKLGLIDSQLGVILILGSGIMPTVIFILKDFMDSIPKSYEESARIYGAKPLRILWDVGVPLARPGLATIAVWAVVQVWGNFLVPYILLQTPSRTPAAVVIYTFYTEGGQPNLALISAFSLLFSIPVIAMYFFVNTRYGFRFYGGIKS
ncbi:carbohydrate ABC transporter permease [Paenarthrobacter sp. Z7-10]|uniref:carbohydrate ABC transporter permease n=1 Tax=Paenarthrobacter sp. Z7-10 TaxID=2787635 RepID=UPI0022A8F22E|nr:carbohydrate ABC transporter permease [Paenarthrobacter sp. Z7-10]